MRSYKEMEINYHERQKEERMKQREEQLKINRELLDIDFLVSGLIMNDEADVEVDVLLNGNGNIYEIQSNDLQTFLFLSCFNYGMAIYDVNNFTMYLMKPYDEMDAVEKRYYNAFEKRVSSRTIYDQNEVKFKIARRV